MNCVISESHNIVKHFKRDTNGHNGHTINDLFNGHMLVHIKLQSAPSHTTIMVKHLP